MSADTAVFSATGRRKSATARVRIVEGTGKLIANGREFENYFSHENFAKQAYSPLLTVQMREKFDVTANVSAAESAARPALWHMASPGLFRSSIPSFVLP